MSRLGLKRGEEHIFLPRLVEKLIVNIQLQHVSLGQPLIPGSRWPLTLMRFIRMYFCSRAGGSRGRDFPTNRSSRCPASFFSPR